MKIRIHKIRDSFIALGNLWKSKEITFKTKLNIFSYNFKIELLYAPEG